MNSDPESTSSLIKKTPCWKLALTVFAVIVILAGIVLMTILCFRNHRTMPEFGINSASINSLNVTKSRIAAEWNITLFVTNHDSYHRLSYDDISLSINYKNEQRQSLLSTIPLKPFSQRSGFTDTIIVQYNMDVDNDVASNIASNSSHGIVNFEVELSTIVQFKDVFNYQKILSMKIVCETLSFQSHEGQLKGASNWILLHGVACH